MFLRVKNDERNTIMDYVVARYNGKRLEYYTGFDNAFTFDLDSAKRYGFDAATLLANHFGAFALRVS